MIPFISRRLIYPLQEKLVQRPTFSYLENLDQTQWFSREDIETIQLQKIKALLSKAKKNSPWHANRIKN